VNLKIEPIGIIRSADSGLTDVLIYSDFEKVLGDMMIEKGTKMLIVHKNMESSDHHQVNVSAAELVNRKETC